MLEIKKLNKYFGDNHVLKDIDFPKVNVVNIQQFCIYLSQEK